MKSDVVRLFQTLPHACGYYARRTAQNLVLDPSAPQLPTVYERALLRGFRRAGGHVYLPQCPECRACVPCRVVVDEFVLNRSQRRCARRNADLSARLMPAAQNDEYFRLYRRYLRGRHAGGGMDDPAPEDFERFLFTGWSPTVFLELRKGGELVAVAVTDVFAAGLSAVYTFYDPDLPARGLGTFAILSQLALARARRLPHVYLGYWISGHPKMDYKSRYAPLEVLRDGAWRRLDV